jgi:hemerythrin-like metal-binding protein
MAFFAWNEKLATGIPKIDEQHKKLISFVNELNDAMTTGKGKDVIGHILDELSEYTKYHFGLEEAAFEKYNYVQKGSHKAAHQTLIKKLDDFIRKYQSNKLVISIEVLGFLINWVNEHIMKEDMQYVPYLKGKEL